jgi:hypothetical protein
MGRKPTHWTPIDRDYETLRIHMQTLFDHLGLTTTGAPPLSLEFKVRGRLMPGFCCCCGVSA